jgi:hypothetical protein
LQRLSGRAGFQGLTLDSTSSFLPVLYSRDSMDLAMIRIPLLRFQLSCLSSDLGSSVSSLAVFTVVPSLAVPSRIARIECFYCPSNLSAFRLDRCVHRLGPRCFDVSGEVHWFTLSWIFSMRSGLFTATGMMNWKRVTRSINPPRGSPHSNLDIL